MCLSKFANKEYDEFLCPLNNRNLDESLSSDKCDYIDLDHCTNLNPNGLNLVITHLNVCSLIVNQSSVRNLLDTMKSKNSEVDILILCETFLRKNTIQMVNLPGYTLGSNHRTNSKGGGTTLLIRNSITYKQRPNLDVFDEKITESVFIEVVAKGANR